MDSQSNPQDKENVPRGCLKLNNKIYPVYEGLNTVGRNPGAIINIKNLNISHQHAIITIVDENTHFISDFKSSNGTVVDNRKLNPLKLYKLNNGASIKFADIFCTYKKLDHNELVSDNFEETQSLNESFYAADTQTVNLPNSDELVFNEMATQIVSPKPLSFNELPTQIFNFNDSKINEDLDEARDDSSNDSVDFMTMQKTQTQAFALNNMSDSDTEEQPSLQSGITPIYFKKNVLSSDSEETKLTPEDKESLSNSEPKEELSQICPVKTGRKNILESDSDTEEYSLPVRNKSRYIISDDDETDIEDNSKAEESMNNTDIIPTTQDTFQKPETSKADHNHDHSSMGSFRLEISEATDENEENKNENIASVDEDHMYCQKNTNEEEENGEKPENTEENLAKADAPKRDTVTEDHIYCQLLDTQSVKERKNAEGSHSPRLQHTQEDQQDVEGSILPSHEKLVENDKKSVSEQKENDENSNSQAKKELTTDQKERKKNENEGKAASDIFDQSTQQLDLDGADDETQSVEGDKQDGADSDHLPEELGTSNDQKLEEKNKNEGKEGKTDGIFGQPPQELDLDGADDETQSIVGDKQGGEDSDRLTEELETSVDQKLEENKDENKEEKTDDIFDQPTQQVDLNFVDDETLSIAGNEVGGENSDRLREELAASTDQVVEEKNKSEEEISENIQSTSDDKTTKKDDKKDDIFTQPTQQIEMDFVKNNGQSLPENKADDIELYLQPMQQMETSDGSSDKDKSDDDIYIQPTQQIGKDDQKSRKSDDDFYLLPTQPLNTSDDLEKNKNDQRIPQVDTKTESVVKDHDFARPFQRFSPKKKSVPQDDEDDETFFLPPTQALEILHKDDASASHQSENLSDQNSNSNEVEDQLEMLFYSQSDHRFVATQQLVDVLEDKDDNEDIIDDSIIEEGGLSSDSKIPKFASVDSIRMILDDNVEINGDETKKNEEKVKENNVDEKKKETEVGNSKGRKKGRKDDTTIEENVSEKQKEVEVGGSKNKKRGRKDDTAENKTIEEKTNDKSEEKEDNKTKKNDQTKEETSELKAKSDKKLDKRKVNKKKQGEDEIKVESSIKTKQKEPEKKQEKESKTRSKKEDLKEPVASTSTRRRTVKVLNLEDEKESQVGTNEPKKDNARIRRKKESVVEEDSEASGSSDKIGEIKESNMRTRRKKETDTPETGNENNDTNNKISTRKQADNENAKRKKDNVAPEASEKIEKANSSAKTPTRKRNLRTTDLGSDDEFEPKIQKTDTPKKVVPETPTRKSARTRKARLDPDEVCSVPSSGSVANEVISVSSASSDEPTRKSRRLSANSRAQRNEEEKHKQNETKTRGRKTPIPTLSPAIPTTPERSKRQLKPKVVFTMMDSPELESLIRHLGGSVVDTVDACTVLVTESVKRSQKLLCAVGQGKPVCSPQWLHACKKAYSFLDPWNYILVDKEAEQKWDFSLRESLNRSTKSKLLENYTFQIMVNTAADVLKGAIEACGGTCVNKNLAKCDSDHLMIVSSEQNKNKYAKVVKQNPKIKVVETEAIFDGTLRQEFRFNKYYLS